MHPIFEPSVFLSQFHGRQDGEEEGADNEALGCRFHRRERCHMPGIALPYFILRHVPVRYRTTNDITTNGRMTNETATNMNERLM